MAYNITRSFNDRTGETRMEQEIERFEVSGGSFLSAPPPQVAERIRRQPECRLLWAVLQDVGPATAVCSLSRLLPEQRPVVRRRACWASCQDWSAVCRRWKR
jgi:hypothetical protein